MSPLSLNTNLMAMNAGRNLTAHYAGMSNSIRRLSSGLRVGTAADDAAGLAIRELMRADIAALNQGIRNANDAISLVQTADGALGIIDEKLIRMKELAEQAATGTYNSDQRLMIDSEFQAMASEIQRIAVSTDFNGVKLLDGSLSGPHDGSGLTPTGELKVHFGTGNDSAEDYYYVRIGDATLHGLGLQDGGASEPGNTGGVPILSDKLTNGQQGSFKSGAVSFAIIPAGTTGIVLDLDDTGINDDIQIFTRDGTHLAGTLPANWGIIFPPAGGIPDGVLTEQNGFLPGANYQGGNLNNRGGELTYNGGPHNFSSNGMNFQYTGSDPQNPGAGRNNTEKLTIDKVTEDLVVIITGAGDFNITAAWAGDMPTTVGGGGSDGAGGVMSIKTQELAQKGLERIDDAIIKKDKIRAHLGATQNRLENTVTNLSVQAENLRASESRISDADVAVEMTEFTRNQILTQSAAAMLAQANSLPKMLVSLINAAS